MRRGTNPSRAMSAAMSGRIRACYNAGTRDENTAPSGSRGRAGVRISNLPPWLSLLCMAIYIKEEPTMQIRVLKTLDISNPHSFTLVCCGVIPVDISWLVGLDRHTAESRRVTSRRRLGQILGQIREPFRNRKPAVSFLSRGQKRAGFEAQNHSKRMVKRPIVFFVACFA